MPTLLPHRLSPATTLTTSLALTLAALFCLTPSLADAQTPAPPSVAAPAPIPEAPRLEAPPAPRRPVDLGAWWRDSELAEEIDLDEGTVDALERLFLDHRVRLAELSAELDRAHAALDFARHQENEETRRDAEDRLFEVRSRMQSARAELLVEVRALLTAEQWAGLEAYRQRHRLPAPAAPGPAAPGPAAPGPAAPSPSAPPAPPAPSTTDAASSLRATPDAPPAPAPPAPPSAPLPPAPPALSWWTDASIRAELDLADEQIRALEDEAAAAAPRLLRLRTDVEMAESELSRLVGLPDLDRDAARRQVDALTTARRALLGEGRDLERRLLAVLTPEQRRRLGAI